MQALVQLNSRLAVQQVRDRPCQTGGCGGALGAHGGQGILAGGMVPVGQECAAWACQGQTAAAQGTGGAHLGGGDRGLGEQATAPQDGACLGVDRSVCSFAAVAGLPREGMTQDARDPVCGAEGGEPVPGKQTCGCQDDRRTGGSDGRAQRLGGRCQVPVHQRCTGLVEDAHVHGAGVEIDTTGKRGWGGVASPCGLLLVRYEGCGCSQQTTAVCWGGGLKKYQSRAGDGVQRPLRARCPPRLKRSVRFRSSKRT